MKGKGKRFICVQPICQEWVRAWPQAVGGAAVRSRACEAAFGSWLTFLCTCGQYYSPAGVFGSGVSCTHIFLQRKIILLLLKSLRL